MESSLEKAKLKTIVPEGREFEVYFNPSEYQLTRANQFVEVAIPGLAAPLLQFGRGSAQTLTMQLFFDTYDPVDPNQKDKDVREFTGQVTKLLEIVDELHAPPICLFSWGKVSFVGVLEQANMKCTLFLPNGRPVRATVDVVFKEYFDGKKQEGRLQSAHYTKRYVVQRGDTLSSIAGKKYENPQLWREIAKKNGLDDPFAIQPGQVLVIPALE